MLKQFTTTAGCLILTGILSSAQADSILVYESTTEDGSNTEHTIAISGRWLKLESTPKGKADYIVMDTGRMLMFEIDDEAKHYQVTRMGRLYWPETPMTSPKFVPMRKKQTVSGVACQQVREAGEDMESTVAEHCMSAGGPLGLNAREMITLSRLFMSARRIGLPGWIGVATPEERQVSILSQGPEGAKQEFKSVTHKPLPNDLMKIPVDYKRLKPDLPPKEKRPPLKASPKPKDADVQPESTPAEAKTEPAKAEAAEKSE
jgi:hypothetical protein